MALPTPMSVPNLKSIGPTVREIWPVINFLGGVFPLLPTPNGGHVTVLGVLDGIVHPNVCAKFGVNRPSRS